MVRLYDGHTLVPSIRRAGWSGAGDEAVHKNDTIKSCAFHSQSRMGVVQEVRLYDGHTRDSCVTQDSCVKSQEVRLSQE